MGLVCDLLVSGRMSVLLRKGGINENGFWVEAEEFLPSPTVRAPVDGPVLERYAGRSSWVPLEIGSFEPGDPVVSRDEVERTTARTRAAVS